MIIGAGGVALVAGLALFHGAAESGEDPIAPDEIRSVDIASDCDHPVWISYGRTAPYQPRDALTLGAGASSTQSMLEGDRVWLLDDVDLRTEMR